MIAIEFTLLIRPSLCHNAISHALDSTAEQGHLPLFLDAAETAPCE